MQLFECANNDGYRYGEDDSIGRFNLFVFLRTTDYDDSLSCYVTSMFTSSGGIADGCNPFLPPLFFSLHLLLIYLNISNM